MSKPIVMHRLSNHVSSDYFPMRLNGDNSGQQYTVEGENFGSNTIFRQRIDINRWVSYVYTEQHTYLNVRDIPSGIYHKFGWYLLDNTIIVEIGEDIVVTGAKTKQIFAKSDIYTKFRMTINLPECIPNMQTAYDIVRKTDLYVLDYAVYNIKISLIYDRKIIKMLEDAANDKDIFVDYLL